jgi:hypothetical protein
MDWTEYATDILINKKTYNTHNTFEVIYEDQVPIFEIPNLYNSHIINTVSRKILFNFVRDNSTIFGNITKHILNSVYPSNNSYLMEFITNILDNYVIIPVNNHYVTRLTCDLYGLIKHLNISPNHNILIYYDKLKRLDKYLLYFTNKEHIHIFENMPPNVKYDLWYSSNIDIYDNYTCNWLFYRIPWYINQLFIIAEVCNKNATCIFTFDYEFLSYRIYKEFIMLLCCFMDVSFYNDSYTIMNKCYLIGRNLKINKLKKWKKEHSPIEEFKDVYTNEQLVCNNIKPVITSLNLKVNKKIIKNINKILKKYNKVINNVIKIICHKFENFNDYLLQIISISLKNAYKYAKKFPFDFNMNYSKPDFTYVYNKNDFTKLYYPNINNVNLLNIKHSSNALYNLINKETIIDIVNKIHSIIKNNKLIEVYSLNGLFSIYFANKVKHITSIEPDYGNYKILVNNTSQYQFTNIICTNQEPINYINLDTEAVFFDACKHNIYDFDNKMKIKIDKLYCEDMIDIIFNKCDKVKLFITTTNPKYIDREPQEIYSFDNVYLLLFHN